MDNETFEQLVNEGIAAIPEPFRSKIENVAFIIEDRPSRRQRREMHLDHDHTLLGLYEGIPQTQRGEHYFAVLPDKITIFKEPILELSADHDEIRKIVAETVWHEIGHHFGLTEAQVRRRERERRANSE